MRKKVGVLDKFVDALKQDKKVLENSNSELLQQNTALESRLGDPLLKRLPTIETMAVNVLFLGIGGSGKTSLIRALSGSPNAAPSRATNENNLYSLAHEVNTEQEDQLHHRRLIRFFLSDHIGQNFDSVKKTDFYDNEALEHLPQCIVFVLDVFEPIPAHVDAPPFSEAAMKERAAKHVSAFSRELLQILTSELNQGSTIIAFINKIDLMPTQTASAFAEVKACFAPLLDMLSRVRGAEFKVIFGSANSGLGIAACSMQHDQKVLPNLYEELTKASVKVAG